MVLKSWIVETCRNLEENTSWATRLWESSKSCQAFHTLHKTSSHVSKISHNFSISRLAQTFTKRKKKKKEVLSRHLSKDTWKLWKWNNFKHFRCKNHLIYFTNCVFLLVFQLLHVVILFITKTILSSSFTALFWLFFFLFLVQDVNV